MRMITKKDLYCPVCKNYPDKIIEVYQEPIRETRIWDTDCYVLEDSNIEDVEYEQLCGKCESKLIIRTQ